MKVVLALIFLLKALASEEVNSLSQIYIKKQPSTKPYGDDKFKINFEFVVPNDLTIDTFKSSSSFKLSLLPPSNLKFVKEGDAFKVLSSELSKTEVLSRSLPSRDVLKDETNEFGLGSCKTSAAEKILASLDADSKKSIGFMVKKDLKSDISKLSLKKSPVVEISLKQYTSKLSKGTYTWSGIFEISKNLELETGISEHFDDFVVGLGHFGGLVSNEDKYCFTLNKVSASVMFKHLEDSKITLIGCDAVAAPQLGEIAPSTKVSEPDFSAEYKFDSKDGKLKLLFKFEMGYIIYTFGSKLFHFTFTVPKEVKEVKMFSASCESQLKANIPVDSCSYDSEKSQIQVGVLHSEFLARKETTFEFDITSSMSNLEALSKLHKYTLAIYSDSGVKLSKNIEDCVEAAYKLSHSYDRECKAPLTLIAQNLERRFLSKKTFITKKDSSQLKHTETYALYSYDVTKAGDNFLMKIYLRNDKKFKSKLRLCMYLSDSKNYMEIKEPKSPSENILSEEISNKGVKMDFEKIEVSLDFTKNEEVKEDTYFEIPVLFSTTLKQDDLTNPGTFRMKLEDESGKALYEGVFKKMTKAVPRLDTEYKQGETTLHVSKPRSNGTNPTITFRLATLAEPNLSLVFEVERANKIKSYSHVIKGDFEYKQEVKVANQSYYRIEFQPSSNPKTKINATIELQMVTEDKEFSMDAMTVSLVSNFGVKSLLEESKEKVLFTKTIKFEAGDFKEGEVSLPCFTNDTRFTGSRFRLLENSSFIFARTFDCKRPWLPHEDQFGSKYDVSVEDSSSFKGFTVKETLSFNDPLKSGVVKKLLEVDNLYANSLYVFVDKVALETLKAQMISAKICKKSDATCPDYDNLPVLTKFMNSIFDEGQLMFHNVYVGYYDAKAVHVYKCLSKAKKIELEGPTDLSDVKDLREAFENFILMAYTFAHFDTMGSFSVVSIMDREQMEPIKKALKEYKVPSDPRANNGKLSSPVYIEMIPVDKTATLEVKFVGCGDVERPKDAGVLELSSRAAIEYEQLIKAASSSEERYTMFSNYTYSVSFEEQKVKFEKSISSFGSKLELPSSKPLSGSTLKREDFTLFFRVRAPLRAMCVSPLKSQHIPLATELKSLVKTMAKNGQSFQLFATCSAFDTDNASKAKTKYTVSYRGVKIGEYSITPSSDDSDNLYSECDLFSLYKHLTTPKLPVHTS